MATTTTLYCELMDHAQVNEFDSFMQTYGFKRTDRPCAWAEREPYWMKAGQPRGENDDPLAAVIFNFHHDACKYSIYSAYRCSEGKLITPEQMEMLILATVYKKLPEL